MDQKKRIDKSTVRRTGVVMCGFVLAAAVMVSALADLQLVNHAYYKAKVLSQMTVSTEVNPERGTIYDRNGSILAVNSLNYLIFISPQDIIDGNEEKDENGNKKVYTWTSASGKTESGLQMNTLVAKGLSEMLGVDEAEVLKKAALSGRRYEVIKKEVDEATAEKVRAFISEHDLTRQIYLRASSKRTYPYSNLASQVIGFVNKDGAGIYGIESYYNNLLEGTSGKYIAAQDAHSKDMPFEYESYIDAENGYNIETTLDVYIQYELENQLKATYEENDPNERVCGIVMNVNTGEILAMATYPTFDLNDPYTLDEDAAAKLEALGYSPESDEYTNARFNALYNMWSNKAVNSLYEPGSTFKIITSAMGFDERLITETSPFNCTGKYFVKGYGNVHCHLTSGHGAITFAEGLQQSCNPVFMIIGENLGIKKFYNYFNSFGYLGRTGVDLPAESYPIVTPQNSFTGVSLAVYSFGQTFKTTPIQQIRAVAAVANGGYLVTPHVLKSIKDSDGNIVAEFSADPLRQVVSTEASQRVTAILEEGVSGDGGAKNAYVKGYKVAAKTGTSEKRDLIAQFGNQPYYRVGSTVAYAPADDPEIAVLIMVDEPTNGVVYGSRVAAPYVSNVLESILPYLGYEPEYTAKDLEKAEVVVPNCINSDVSGSKGYAEALGLTCEIVGDGSLVTGQIPAPGEVVNKYKSRVIFYTNGETPKESVKVPVLEGKTAEAANRMLIDAGLNIRFEGAAGHQEGAIVITQTVPAGTMVPRGTAITVEISYLDTED